MGIQDLVPRWLLTVCISLVSHSFPSLTNIRLNLPIGIQGRSWRAEQKLFPIIKEMRDIERSWVPKPNRTCMVSTVLIAVDRIGK